MWDGGISRGTSMALFFNNRMASARRKDAALELMMRARTILRVGDDAVVSVSEHACGEAKCCGTRTVILVMRPDQPTEAIKIDKALDAVTQADLSDALVPSAYGNGVPGMLPT
jgi:hypothetical protein